MVGLAVCGCLDLGDHLDGLHSPCSGVLWLGIRACDHLCTCFSLLHFLHPSLTHHLDSQFRLGLGHPSFGQAPGSPSHLTNRKRVLPQQGLGTQPCLQWPELFSLAGHSSPLPSDNTSWRQRRRRRQKTCWGNMTCPAWKVREDFLEEGTSELSTDTEGMVEEEGGSSSLLQCLHGDPWAQSCGRISLAERKLSQDGS